MKTSFLERLVPRPVRLAMLRSRIIRHFELMPGAEVGEDRSEVVEYLRHHPLTVFPYPFEREYNPDTVQVNLDDSTGLLYTLWDGKRLYYKDGTSVKRAKRYFNSLLLEQDPRSPHRYLTPAFDVKQGDVIADVGAAEGNFTLSVIDKIHHAYLFEPDPAWIRALKTTFEPWKDKVTIVPTFVGASPDANTITLDGYFNDGRTISFLKADVEGCEGDLLAGAKQLIARSPGLRTALCTYHRQEDAGNLKATLSEMGFACEFSDGYMIYHFGRENVVQAPYLRKAVIRGARS